jgi:hypothetical protein
MANDPTARTIMDNLKVSPADLRELAASVASIKVQGLKPA